MSCKVSVSLNWTDWSVDSRDCQRHCSNMGGTVTASRRCYSHKVTLEKSICTKYNISTKVFKCGQQHCPISGLFVALSFFFPGSRLSAVKPYLEPSRHHKELTTQTIVHERALGDWLRLVFYGMIISYFSCSTLLPYAITQQIYVFPDFLFYDSLPIPISIKFLLSLSSLMFSVCSPLL